MDGRLLLVAAGWLAGWWLLWRMPRVGATRPAGSASTSGLRPGADGAGVTVVIPARNEAHALPLLLDSLAAQDRPPDQVVVVDDGSDDGTAEVAARYAFVTVVHGEPLPPGWTGKTWALHQGVAAATHERLVFLDADVRLAPGALTALLAEHDRRGGLVSVQPFHQMERAYEHLAAIFNVVSVMGVGSASPGRDGAAHAAFGPCLVTWRDDYEAAGGHDGVRGEIVEDVALARSYRDAGMPVHAFGGHDLVAFRMYPKGLRQLIEGFSKNMATGAGSVPIARVLLSFLWVTGALASVQVLLELVAGSANALPAATVGLVVLSYVVQLTIMLRQLGDFTWVTAVLYPVPLGVFVVVFARSLWLTVVRRSVGWSGREIPLSRSRRWATVGSEPGV